MSARRLVFKVPTLPGLRHRRINDPMGHALISVAPGFYGLSIADQMDCVRFA
jgi:hypothetical protein